MTLQAMDDRRTVQPPNAQTPRWLEKLEFKRQARAIPIENTLTNTKQFSLCRIILLFSIYICSFIHYTKYYPNRKKTLVISFTKVKGVIRFINPSKLLVKYLNLKFFEHILNMQYLDLKKMRKHGAIFFCHRLESHLVRWSEQFCIGC